MTRLPRTRRPILGAALLLLSGAAPVVHARAVVQGEAEGQETRLFAIRDTRDARALAESSVEHLKAKRWSEAILTLQRLIEEHSGDILPARMQDSTGRPSTYAFHTGAAAWATERLRALPPEARELYRTRFEKPAHALLFSARASGDRRALLEVAEHWPLTEAAEVAYWTVGDLELELGSLADAERAWKRAADCAKSAGKEPGAGARKRFGLVREWSGEKGGDQLLTGDSSDLRLPGPSEGHGPVPEDFAEPWTHRLPASPFRNNQRGDNLFPVFFDDQVFLSTSWQTLALDAYTGELQWEYEDTFGWSTVKRKELERGIDFDAVIIAPAVSGSIVISPVQVPFARLGYATFQGIRITVPIPERRLFAFDRTTGEPLWNHMPPPMWEGDTGNYAQRMSLAGPPVATGSRVLVPCYLMQGRVDFHVACYDTSTGELLWSTQLISGQRALNMFGRHEHEFCAPPIRIEGDRAVVLTQLGTVAALDLYTGQILWQSLYEQIPLPKTRSWNTQRRPQYWRNAAPVVADGAVIATPMDSEDMVAFDLEQGTVLWAFPQGLFNQSMGRGSASEVDTLLGADDDTIYLGGGRLAAFHSPAGLASMSTTSRLTPAWSFSVDPADGSRRSPRAVLGRDAIVLSSRRGRIAVDKRTGLERRRSPVPWNRDDGDTSIVGNLFLGDGMLFTANADEISGLFDWNILEVRALERIEEDPSDISAVLTLAQVREQHATLLFQMGDVREALTRLEEARRLLESNLEHPSHAPQVAARLHTVLRAAARAHESLAEIPAALSLLEDALALAPDSDDVRDTLLQREALLRGRDTLQWLETLDELERRCTAKSMPREAWSLVLTEPGSGGEPALGLTARDLEQLESDLPVGLWVHLMRARSFEAAGDAVSELEELHACLARYGTYVLAPDRTAFDVVCAWISDVLDHNDPRVYSRFERRARAMLEEAGRTVSTRDMELVRRHYPHSQAAREAGDALLELAVQAEDADRVTRLVRESISDEPHPTEQDAQKLYLLAEALGRAGNLELQRGLLEALAEDHADLVLETGRRQTVQERLDELPEPLQPDEVPSPVDFGADLTPRGTRRGSFFSLGRLPLGFRADEPPAPARQVVLQESGDSVLLYVHSAADPTPSSPLAAVSGMHDARLFRVALTPRIVILSDGQDLVGIDVDDGSNAWPKWTAPRGWRLSELVAGGGVLICMLESEEGDYRAVALDATGGRELWQLGLPPDQTWRAPVLDGHRAVFLTQSHSWQNDARARVVDLYRGVELSTIDLGDQLSAETYESAFAREGILVLAGFHMASIPECNRVAGYDLDSGREAWSYSLGGGREFKTMVQHGDATYLVVSPGDDGAGGAVLQLETRLGAVRPVMQLRLEDRLVGIDRRRDFRSGPIRLEAPYLFFYSAYSGKATTPLTAVHLPYGKRWVCSLRVPYDELYDVGMAFPAVSESTVAVAYTKKAANYLSGDTYLTLIDREGGMKLGDYVLPQALGTSDDLELIGLGDTLFVLSHNSKEGFPMDVWETRR